MSLKLHEDANEAHPAIMYVCAHCAEHAPEGCGHTDPDDIRRTPDGSWLCEVCWDAERHEDDPDFWDLLIAPKAYLPAPTPAPQMPEDVANVIYALRPMNGCNEMDDAVALIEAQAAENVGLRAKLAEVTAERDQWRSDCLDANQSEHALRKRAEQAEAAGTFAQGIKAAKNAIAQLPMPMSEDMLRGHEDAYRVICALTPPVMAHETPIREPQAGLSDVGEPLDETSLRARIGELGNQIHNLACEMQEGDTRDRLEDLRSIAWGLASVAPTAPQADRVREADHIAVLKSMVARFQGDFNAMTEDEIDRECAEAESRVNEDTEWLEAVAARKELRALAGEQHD